MELGNFSVSLAVKNLEVSRKFYEAIGFKVIAGGEAVKMYILQNATSTIGLFQGMFEKNMLTFNPGWDRQCTTLEKFDDIRDIQKVLNERGISALSVVDEASTGPAHLMIVDPDGNPILIDQHVPRP
ncbi:MAG: VOC family protein [Planctomycetaceae bacterium]|nr:VOC family protein [Planctomycetaceae bacterium]